MSDLSHGFKLFNLFLTVHYFPVRCTQWMYWLRVESDLMSFLPPVTQLDRSPSGPVGYFPLWTCHCCYTLDLLTLSFCFMNLYKYTHDTWIMGFIPFFVIFCTIRNWYILMLILFNYYFLIYTSLKKLRFESEFWNLTLRPFCERNWRT